MESSHTENNKASLNLLYIYFSFKITCRILLIEQWNVIVSGSEDTSVRVWTFEGHYIGRRM